MLGKIVKFYQLFQVFFAALLIFQAKFSLCGWRPNIDEFKTECQLPIGIESQYNNLPTLSFPKLTVFSGLKKSCSDCKLTIKIRYSTDGEYFSNYYNHSTNVLISPRGESFLWFNETFVAKELEITATGLGNSENFELYGCPAWKYALALGMESGLIQDREIHVRKSFGDTYNAFAARLNTAKSNGWLPSKSVQTTGINLQEVLITIDLSEVKKVVAIGVQHAYINRRSDFLIRYNKAFEGNLYYTGGDQVSSNEMSSHAAKVINVPKFKNHFDTFHYHFKYELLARFITYMPIVHNTFFPTIKLELYGVPRYTPTHHWFHKDGVTDTYSYMDFVASTKWEYTGKYLKHSKKASKHYKTPLFSSKDCIVNPNVCSSGLTVSFMATGTNPAVTNSFQIGSKPKRISKIVNGVCVHDSTLDIELNETTGIYYETVKLVRGVTVLNAFLQMYPFHSSSYFTVTVLLRIFPGKSIDFVNNCEYSSDNNEFVSGHIIFKFYKAKVFADITEYLHAVYNSMRWNYGNSLVIVFQPLPGSTDSARITAMPNLYQHPVYACTSYRDNIVKLLPEHRLSAAHDDCSLEEYKPYQAKWDETGFWRDCTKNSNYLQVDLAAFYHISKIKTHVTDDNQAETFHLSFSANNIHWDYALNGDSYNKGDKFLFEIVHTIEIHPLPSVFYSRFVRLHPVSYKGDYFQIKIDVVACTNNGFGEVFHWPKGIGGKNVSLSPVDSKIFARFNMYYESKPEAPTWSYINNVQYLKQDIDGTVYHLDGGNIYKNNIEIVLMDKGCLDFDVFDGKLICILPDHKLAMMNSDGSLKIVPTGIVYKARISAAKKLIYALGGSNWVWSIDIELSGQWIKVSETPCQQIKVTTDGILWCLWLGWIYELNSYYNDFGFVSFNSDCRDFDVGNDRLACIDFSDGRLHLFTKEFLSSVEIPILSSGLQRYKGHSQGCGFSVFYNNIDQVIQVTLQTDDHMVESSFPFANLNHWNTYAFAWSKEQNKLNLFVNDEHVNSSTAVSSPSKCLKFQNFVNIGSFYDFTYLYSTNIYLRDLKMWNEYLSEEEFLFTFSNTDLLYHQIAPATPTCTEIILGADVYFCVEGHNIFTHPKQFPLSSWTPLSSFHCIQLAYIYEKLFCVHHNQWLYYYSDNTWPQVYMHSLNGLIMEIHEHYHSDWGFLVRRNDNVLVSVQYPSTGNILVHGTNAYNILGIHPGLGNIIQDQNNSVWLWQKDDTNVYVYYDQLDQCKLKYRYGMLWCLKDKYVSQIVDQKIFQTSKKIECVDFEVDLLYVYCLNDMLHRKAKISPAEIEDFSNNQVDNQLYDHYHNHPYDDFHESSICTTWGQQTGPCYDLGYSLKGGQQQTEMSYYPNNDQATFYEQKLKCEYHGGKLASVHSDEDMHKISSVANEGDYLGFSNNEWVDGSEFDYDKTSGGTGQAFCWKDQNNWWLCGRHLKKYAICQGRGNILYRSFPLWYTTSPEYDCQPSFTEESVLSENKSVHIFTFKIDSQVIKDSMIKTAHMMAVTVSTIIPGDVYIGLIHPNKNCSDFNNNFDHNTKNINGKLVKWFIRSLNRNSGLLSVDLSDLISISLHKSNIIQISVWTMEENVGKIEIKNVHLKISYYSRSESKFIFFPANMSKPYYHPSFYETSYFSAKRLKISFWYHMYGKDIGTLMVWVKTIFSETSVNPIGIFQGNSGSTWKQITLATNFYTDNIKLIFAAYHGNGPYGHIAIDSISASSNPFLEISESNIDFEWHYKDRRFHKLLDFHGCTVPLLLLSFANNLQNSGKYAAQETRPENSVPIFYEADKFGFPLHSSSVRRKSGTNQKILSYSKITNLANDVTSQFTILFLLRFKFWQYSMTVFQLRDDSKTFHVSIRNNQLIIELQYSGTNEMVYESGWKFENETWTYIAITFNDGNMKIYKDNQEDLVTAYINMENFMPFPTNLHFFRDPDKLGTEPENDFYEGSISCFQLYAEELSLNAIRMVEFCPHRLENVYCPDQCHLYGGVCIPLQVGCDCPKSLQIYYQKDSCKNGFEDTSFNSSTFYISFDREDVVSDHKGFIQALDTENMYAIPSPVNHGRCMKQSDIQLAQLSVNCLTSSSCPEGFLLSLWLYLDQDVTSTFSKLFSVGNLHVTYNVTHQGFEIAFGNVHWILDNSECNITFELPLKVWFFLFIGFNTENISVGVNNKMYQQNCGTSDISGQTLVEASIQFGEARTLCVDEFAGGIATIDYKTVIENYYMMITKGPLFSQYVPIGIETELPGDFNSHRECSGNCTMMNFIGVIYKVDPIKKCICVNDIDRFELQEGESAYGSLVPYDILHNETADYLPPVYLELSAASIEWQEEFNNVLSVQYHFVSQMISEAINDHLEHLTYDVELIEFQNMNNHVVGIVSINFHYFYNEEVEDMFPEGHVLQKNLEYAFEIKRHNRTDSPVYILDYEITEYNETHYQVIINNEEDFSDPFNKGYLVKIKSYIYDTSDLVLNKTFSVYTGQKTFFLSPILGYRFYNIKIYREKHGSVDPVTQTNITTEAKENIIPPTISYVQAINSTSLILSWDEFTYEYWSAPSLLHYNLFYRKVDSLLDLNVSSYEAVTIPSNETQYVLANLEFFTNYSISLATTNDIGLGFMSHIFFRTLEDEPEVSPNITSIILDEPSTANITWAHIPTDIELMNSYHFNGYELKIKAIYPDLEQKECKTFKYRVLNDSNSILTSSCNLMAAFNLSISACNHKGCGIENLYCFVLGRMKPHVQILVLNTSDINGTSEHTAVNLTVGGLHNETTVITHYQIKYRPIQFDLPTSSVNITVNHTDEEIAYWNASKNTLMNCSEIIYPPVSAKIVNYVLTDLYYNTEYLLTASACSEEGCSEDKSTTLHTSSHQPTCHPTNVTMTSLTSTSLNLKFDLLDRICLKGILTDYRVILLETKYVDDGLNLTLQDYEQLGNGTWTNLNNELIFNDLEEYWNYTVVVAALNEVGYGPLSPQVFCVTLSEIPTAIPSNISLHHLNASSLLVNISLPPLLERNGIILGYHLKILDEYNNEQNINVSALNEYTEVIIENLKPFAWHTIEIQAYNIMGSGPADSLGIRTLESVPSLPPANLTADNVESESITISWRMMDIISRNGILKHFNVTSCGALENNTLHCIKKNVNVSDLVEVYYLDIDCFPSVEYVLMISGCTKIGCGVPGELNITSDEMVPYGTISNITEFNRSFNKLHLHWSTVKPMEQRGVILGYNVTMVRLPRYWKTIQEPVIVEHFVAPDVNLEITNLDNYTSYNISIAAFTKMGAGPFSDNVTFTTPQNVPSDAPSSVNGMALSSSMLYLEWLPIQPENYEGILIFYNVSYQAFDEDDYRYGSVYGYVDTGNPDIVSVNLTNLSLSTDFSITVAGCTEVGCGPSNLPVLIKTLDFVDGAWTDWTPWGECDKSCGLGTEIRQRWCTNPREQAGGRPCSGVPVENRGCNDFPCPGFYLSIPSATCSATCTDLGDDFDCMKVVETFNDVVVFNGIIDGEDYRRTLDISCTTSPTTDKYQENFDPSVLVDTATCRGYKSLPNVTKCETSGGPNVRRLCNCVDKETAQYTEWGNWGVCTKDCGVGYYRRYRECLLGSGCSGKSEDKADCNIHPCPIHGQWSQWTPFSNCSVSCGFGSNVRKRYCDSPAPEHNGMYCDGNQDTEAITGCNPQPCPIHGGWSAWGALSECKHSCGSEGYREKKRLCNNPTPDYDGDDCYGDHVEYLPCVRMKDCTPVLINYFVRFTEEIWHYTMYAINSQTATAVTSKMKDRIHSFYNHDVHLNITFDIEFHKLKKGSVIANFTILYESNPYTQALYLQDAIDNVHYISDMPVTMISLSSPHVPTVAPANVKAETNDLTWINVTWDKVDENHLNGISKNYYVFFRLIEDETSSKQWDNFATGDTFYTIKNLYPGTQYGIRVLAAVEDGNGIASEEIRASTRDGLPFIKPPNCTYQVLSTTKLFLQWDHIPKSQVPGTLVGYEIKYTILFTSVTQVLANSPNLLQRTLYNLRPNTWYNVEVYGFTNAGVGPKQTYNILTPEGAPGAPPVNVILEEHISASQLILRWESVPAEFTNGKMKGYVITYQKYQESGQDLPARQVLHTVKVDAYTFKHVIKGLSSYTKYEVKIYAFTKYGNGPSVVLYGSTCKCPKEFFTNWYTYPPFISQDKKTKDNFTGLFMEILNQIVFQICTPCKTHKNSAVFYNRTKDGQPSMKIAMKNVLNGISENVHFTFPIFKKFTVTRVSGKYPFIRIIQSQGTAMIVYTAPVQTIGLMQMMTAVYSARTIICVAVLMTILTGWVLFFAEQGSSDSDLTLDKSIRGAMEGAWTAFVTMTTVGYGDFVPTTFLAKMVMIVWVFTGFIILSTFSGIVASGITVSRINHDYRLYGSAVAAVNNSFEHRLAIQRNANVGLKNYTTIPEVIEAVGNGEVEIGLIDALSTKGYEKRMKELNVRVYRMLDVVAGHGVVLSGDAIQLENDFRSSIVAKEAEIIDFVTRKFGVLQSELVTVESALFTKEESTSVIIDLLVSLAVLSLLGVTFWLCCRREKRNNKKVKPTDNPETKYQHLTELIETFGLRFSEDFSKTVNSIAAKHDEQRILLVDMKRNYVRFAKRVGLYDALVKSNNRKKKRENRKNANMQNQTSEK